VRREQVRPYGKDGTAMPFDITILLLRDADRRVRRISR
jgi:hypothetical protein